jgi:hypothetical protein
MTIKIKNSGSYVSKLNGAPLINKKYMVDVDSDRKKNKQVIGMLYDNGNIEGVQDTLQNYMKKMSSNNQSIFDLMKNEHSEVNKIPNIAMKITDMPKKTNNGFFFNKQKTRKNNNGISSKLFEFTNLNSITDIKPINPVQYIKPIYRLAIKPKRKNNSRKKRRRRQTRKA